MKTRSSLTPVPGADSCRGGSPYSVARVRRTLASTARHDRRGPQRAAGDEEPGRHLRGSRPPVDRTKRPHAGREGSSLSAPTKAAPTKVRPEGLTARGREARKIRADVRYVTARGWISS